MSSCRLAQVRRRKKKRRLQMSSREPGAKAFWVSKHAAQKNKLKSGSHSFQFRCNKNISMLSSLSLSSSLYPSLLPPGNAARLGGRMPGCRGSGFDEAIEPWFVGFSCRTAFSIALGISSFWLYDICSERALDENSLTPFRARKCADRRG